MGVYIATPFRLSAATSSHTDLLDNPYLFFAREMTEQKLVIYGATLNYDGT